MLDMLLIGDDGDDDGDEQNFTQQRRGFQPEFVTMISNMMMGGVAIMVVWLVIGDNDYGYGGNDDDDDDDDADADDHGDDD